MGIIAMSSTMAQQKIELDPIKVEISGQLLKSNKQIKQEEIILSQGKTIAEVLATINGVSLLKTGTIAKPILNGLHSQRLLLINQGVRHESQQWGAEHADEIDAFAVQDISILKGSDVLRYGSNALAGVIQLNANPIDYSRNITGSVGMALNSNGKGLALRSQIEGGINKLSYRFGITAKKAGNVKTANYYLGNTGSQEINGNLLLNLRGKKNNTQLLFSQFSTEIGIFEGAHIGSTEDILARIDWGRPMEEYNFSYAINSPRQEVTHQVLKLQHVYKIDSISTLEAQYSLQRNHRKEFDLRRVLEDAIPMADLVLTSQQFDFIYQRLQTTIGVSGRLQVNNNVPGTGTTPIIPNFDNHNMGLFFSQKLNIGHHELDLGLRYDYNYFDVAGYRYDSNNPNEEGTYNLNLFTDRKHFNNISGIAGYSVAINPRIAYNSNISLAWRAPSANELYSDGIHHGAAVYELGNANLSSERGTNWTNTLTYSQKNFQVHMNIFTNFIANYIYSQPNPDSIRQTIRGTFPVFQYQQSNAFFYGSTVQLQANLLKNTLYEIGVSAVRAKNLTSNQYFPYIPADNIRHSLRQNINLKQKTNLYIKVENKLQARQKRYTQGTDYTAPPPAYLLFNLASGIYFNKKNIQQSSLHISVENLFNTEYKDYLDRFRYYAHAMGRNFSIKLNHTF